MVFDYHYYHLADKTRGAPGPWPFRDCAWRAIAGPQRDGTDGADGIRRFPNSNSCGVAVAVASFHNSGPSPSNGRGAHCCCCNSFPRYPGDSEAVAAVLDDRAKESHTAEEGLLGVHRDLREDEVHRHHYHSDDDDDDDEVDDATRMTEAVGGSTSLFAQLWRTLVCSVRALLL